MGLCVPPEAGSSNKDPPVYTNSPALSAHSQTAHTCQAGCNVNAGNTLIICFGIQTCCKCFRPSSSSGSPPEGGRSGAAEEEGGGGRLEEEVEALVEATLGLSWALETPTEARSDTEKQQAVQQWRLFLARLTRSSRAACRLRGPSSKNNRVLDDRA